ncbi:hypothetical protein ACFFQW_25335 [Umezawaea endophytica]|uniref:Uncharacterized protein n=1 Tax=Umezawaea endophytica TaxID=1654476 RepID=A0A9X2VRH5_9PSEU|nr:hypothetical protein [Umezawaea endophytica]MCS7481548.1 hypothetical protein [Umezawaea endophytica]
MTNAIYGSAKNVLQVGEVRNVVFSASDGPGTNALPGEPDHEVEFQPVFEAAGGAARLGHALGRVLREGPGWVQHFEGTPAQPPVVIHKQPGRRAGVATRALWEVLGAFGFPDGGTAGVGFPLSDPRSPGRIVGLDDDVVELAGGSWSPRGQMVRRSTDEWVWRPQVSFDDEAFRMGDLWDTSSSRVDLRLRVAARVPFATDDLRITADGRVRLVAALDLSSATEFGKRLAERWGLAAEDVTWQEVNGPHDHNNTRFSAHQLAFVGEDDRPALALVVHSCLAPNGFSGAEIVVDLRVDFGAITKAVEVAEDPRLTLDEARDFFTHGWHVSTTTALLAFTEDPVALPPAGAPRLELYLQGERPGTSGDERPMTILDMVDLSEFGEPRTIRSGPLAVGVTTPVGLPLDEVRTHAGEAVRRMAETYGFTGA